MDQICCVPCVKWLKRGQKFSKENQLVHFSIRFRCFDCFVPERANSAQSSILDSRATLFCSPCLRESHPHTKRKKHRQCDIELPLSLCLICELEIANLFCEACCHVCCHVVIWRRSVPFEIQLFFCRRVVKNLTNL